MSDNYFHWKHIQNLKRTRPEFVVRVLLTQSLQKKGINHFNFYVNSKDVLNEEAVASETLLDEALKYVRDDQFPNYSQDVSEVYSRRFSLNIRDLVPGLNILKFDEIVSDIVFALRKETPVALKERSVAPLTPKDIQHALEQQLPDINLDEIFVTGTVEENGERKILQSRTLVDDIYAHLQHDEIPYYHGDHLGIYTVAYSSQENHLHPQLTLRDINNLVIEIIPGFLI